MWPTVIFIFIPITPIPIHHPLHTCRPIMSWWARRSSPSAARCSTLSPLRLDGNIYWRGPSLHCCMRAADAAAARRRNFPSELSLLYSSSCCRAPTRARVGLLSSAPSHQHLAPHTPVPWPTTTMVHLCAASTVELGVVRGGPSGGKEGRGGGYGRRRTGPAGEGVGERC
jgi:hypothetical protein